MIKCHMSHALASQLEEVAPLCSHNQVLGIEFGLVDGTARARASISHS